MNVLSFSLILSFFLSFQTFAFTDNECLNANFSVDVVHKGKPWGLSDTVLHIEKQACVLRVEHKSMWFNKKHYVVDTCRAPVHVKIENGGINVVKRDGPCGKEQENPSKYCASIVDISEYILNDGLIFAPGEKERLTDDHGRVNCAFLLLDAYLKRGIVFSKEGHYENIIVSKEAPFSSPAPTPILEEEQVRTSIIE